MSMQLAAVVCYYSIIDGIGVTSPQKVLVGRDCEERAEQYCRDNQHLVSVKLIVQIVELL